MLKVPKVRVRVRVWVNPYPNTDPNCDPDSDQDLDTDPDPNPSPNPNPNPSLATPILQYGVFSTPLTAEELISFNDTMDIFRYLPTTCSFSMLA